MSKIDDNLVVHTDIKPFGKLHGRYKISALLAKDGIYVMPSFEIINYELGKTLEVWDNQTYLEKMYDLFQNYKEKTLSEKDLLFIEELKEFIPEEDFEDLSLLFSKAVQLKLIQE